MLIGIAILMMARPTLKVFEQGLLVRNILGENFYAWPLVYGISFPQGAQWALLRMPDDETHPVMAIQLLDRSRAVESLKEVRALHEKYAPPPPKSRAPDAEAMRLLEEQENNRPLGRLEIIDRVKAAKGKKPGRNPDPSASGRRLESASEDNLTLDQMNQRFRVIEDMWKVGSADEQEEYLAELTDMKLELAQITGPESDSAVWLRRTVERLSRNICVEQARL